MLINPDDKGYVLNFLHRELQLSYERYKEAHTHQKGALRLLFGFYGLILAVSLFKDQQVADNFIKQLGPVSYLIPLLIIVVGFAFSVMYWKYEIYTKIYKNCMEQLEDSIYDLLFNGDVDLKKYKITYYAHPKGHPRYASPDLRFETGFCFAMAVIMIMNYGVTFLLFLLVGGSIISGLGLLVTTAVLNWHVLIQLRESEKRRFQQSTDEASSKIAGHTKNHAK